MTSDGYYQCNKDSNPILDEELTNTKKLFQRFVFKKKISNLLFTNTPHRPAYQSFKKSDMDLNLIFDIKRYLDIYKNTIDACKKSNYKTLRDIVIQIPLSNLKRPPHNIIILISKV